MTNVIRTIQLQQVPTNGPVTIDIADMGERDGVHTYKGILHYLSDDGTPMTEEVESASIDELMAKVKVEVELRWGEEFAGRELS